MASIEATICLNLREACKPSGGLRDGRIRSSASVIGYGMKPSGG
ncbi:MAG TPA: hypothetical protein ACQGQH_08070 [Xylella sp.]